MQTAPVTPTPLVMVTLVFLIASTAFAIDISLPALPALATATGSTIEMAQRTIGIFVLGYALGQIPVGLMGDRFGRRPVLIAGMFAFVAFGLATSATENLQALVILRFFQGFAAATGVVLARAVARDITEGAETARLLTFLSSSMGFAMVAAPIMGTVFMAWWGWRGPFIGSALWGGLGLALSLFVLSETRQGPPALSAGAALKVGLWAFARTKRAWFGAAFAGLSFCGIMSLVTLSPAVIMVEQGKSPAQFAAFFAVISMGFIAGSLVLRRFAHRFSVPQLMARTGIGFAICVLAAGCAAAVGQIGLAVVVLVPLLGLLGANLGLSSALGLQPLGHVAGVAAGTMGTLQLLMGGAYSYVSTFAGIDSLVALMVAFSCISGLIAALTWVMWRSGIR